MRLYKRPLLPTGMLSGFLLLTVTWAQPTSHPHLKKPSPAPTSRPPTTVKTTQPTPIKKPPTTNPTHSYPKVNSPQPASMGKPTPTKPTYASPPPKPSQSAPQRTPSNTPKYTPSTHQPYQSVSSTPQVESDQPSYTPTSPMSSEEEDPDPTAFIQVEKEPQPTNMDEIKKRIAYPPLAKEAGIQGKVIVRVLVDKEGRYERHIVLRSPHKLLTEAVEKELPNLTFIPGLSNGQPIKVWVTIPFDFNLK